MFKKEDVKYNVNITKLIKSIKYNNRISKGTELFLHFSLNDL